MHDLSLIEVAEDGGYSGKSINGCPGIQRVMDRVRARKLKQVVIMILDRLAGNFKEACEISESMHKKYMALALALVLSNTLRQTVITTARADILELKRYGT